MLMQTMISLLWLGCPSISLDQAAKLAAGIDPDGAPPTTAHSNAAAFYLEKIRESVAGAVALLEDEGFSLWPTEQPTKDNIGGLSELSTEFVAGLGADHLLPLELLAAIDEHNSECEPPPNFDEYKSMLDYILDVSDADRATYLALWQDLKAAQ